MDIKRLIKREGGVAAFSRALEIPKRTVENWNSDAQIGRKPPGYNVKIYSELLKLRRKLL